MDIYTARLDMVANRVCRNDGLVNEEGIELNMAFNADDDVVTDSVNGTACEYLPVGMLSGKMEI